MTETGRFLPQTGQHEPGGVVAFPLKQLTLGHCTFCKKITMHTKIFRQIAYHNIRLALSCELWFTVNNSIPHFYRYSHH